MIGALSQIHLIIKPHHHNVSLFKKHKTRVLAFLKENGCAYAVLVLFEANMNIIDFEIKILSSETRGHSRICLLTVGNSTNT